jgi:hypothetical protein
VTQPPPPTSSLSLYPILPPTTPSHSPDSFHLHTGQRRRQAQGGGPESIPWQPQHRHWRVRPPTPGGVPEVWQIRGAAPGGCRRTRPRELQANEVAELSTSQVMRRLRESISVRARRRLWNQAPVGRGGRDEWSFRRNRAPTGGAASARLARDRVRRHLWLSSSGGAGFHRQRSRAVLDFACRRHR